METDIKNKEIKNWDTVTIILLILSGVIILFSFFAPYYFTQSAKNSDLDFTATGAIGDTLGGIMNPFIALVGILLTFLAFYMQIKANQIQKQIFFDGLNLEKEKELKNEKKEHITRLKVVKALLNSMMSYYRVNGENLNEFIQLEKGKPLAPNIYAASTSASYQNFLKLDLLETYNSLVYYFQDKEIEWEKDFIQVLDYLDFYDKMIIELRTKYQDHIGKKFMLLTEEGNKLNSIMNDIFVHKDLKDLPENQTFTDLTKTDTDFELLQNNFLIPILKKIFALYKQTEYLDFKNFLDSLSSVNKKIGTEKLQSEYYVKNLEKYYNNYFKEENEFILKIQSFNNLIQV